MDRVVMGLDQSLTCTGVVIRTGDTLIHHETIKTTKDMDKLTRMRTIAFRLSFLIQTLSVDTVVIETLALGAAGDATRDLAGLFWLIKHVIDSECVCERHRDGSILIKEVAPNSLKKLATGNGRASKVDMLDALNPCSLSVAESYPKTKGRFDIADAMHLAATEYDMAHVEHYAPVEIDLEYAA